MQVIIPNRFLTERERESRKKERRDKHIFLFYQYDSLEGSGCISATKDDRNMMIIRKKWRRG